MGASVQLIRENSLRAVQDGFIFEVRLNWYRSLPLSSVDILSVKVNGEAAPVEQVLFEINGHRYSQAELWEKYEEFWFVQDFGVVHVRQPGLVKAGETYTLETEISLRFPYMSIGPGKFLTTVTRGVSTQVAG
jgi:hypothetical protein